MNHTLYQQLAPLGFADWLSTFTREEDALEICKECDALPIEAYERTSLNALAFRWLREEKIIFAYAIPYKYRATDINEPVKYKSIVNTYIQYHEKVHESFEQAEHEALNKCLEILEGGEDE